MDDNRVPAAGTLLWRRKLFVGPWRLSLQQNIFVGATMAKDESSETIPGIILI
jgi:hypothetical protein